MKKNCPAGPQDKKRREEDELIHKTGRQCNMTGRKRLKIEESRN